MDSTMERIPKSGEIYRHFKDRLYQVITVAKHSETGEQLVIYQALYGDFSVYARPLGQFVSEVDKEKYPDVKQKYRFEKVKPGKTDAEKENAPAEKTQAQKQNDTAGERNGIHPAVLAFLDTDDFDERYRILTSVQDIADNQMIDTFAVALDVVIPEGAADERYEQLRQCLRTRQKYESSRLR